jgi:hypothetical protein
MNPGRELDSLIAEKVMGEKFVPYDLMLTSYPGNTVYATPPYSTDLAAAWEVMEKLGLAIGKNEIYPELGAYVCLESMSEGESWLFNSNYATYADTAPHAICLAALKATQ